MGYLFVHAFHDYGPRLGPVKAFVVHMAEGGGTVGFLSRENARGVSVHYVIQYSGRIVQMLREDHASGSINPNDLRTSEGPDPYGATVRREVMGAWDRNPNQATITLEIEGFAADGPNVDQRLALGRLVADVRSRHPRMGLLGHRDFTSRKACPGARIPWADLGGHGPYVIAQETTDMAIMTTGLTLVTSHVVRLPAGTRVREHADDDADVIYTVGSQPEELPYFGTSAGFSAVRVNPGDGSRIAYTASAASPFPDPTPPPGADCSVQDQKIADAVAVLTA